MIRYFGTIRRALKNSNLDNEKLGKLALLEESKYPLLVILKNHFGAHVCL